MLGFARLTIRQAQEALKNGRPEEAHRLLIQPCAQGHRKSWELLQQTGKAFVERGRKHLRQNNFEAAWNDLVTAEQVGSENNGATELRQDLTYRGLSEARLLMNASEPSRALEIIGQLKGRSVHLQELHALEEAAKAWMQAKEQATRGEFALALQTCERVRKLAPEHAGAVGEFTRTLETRQKEFTTLIVSLHEAAQKNDWQSVVRLSEQVLALAPQHFEARKARARAWRVIDPETVTAQPKSSDAGPAEAKQPERGQRFLLWIDGVGGYLVCLGNHLSIGQATPDTYTDIPIFADVSRMHANLSREAEGYILEATRSIQVNGNSVQKASLQSGDRITLGASCQLQFRLPVPISTTARLDLVSGHRLPLSVDGVLLMAETLILGAGPQAHVVMPDATDSIVLYRQKDGLGVRCKGSFTIDGQRVQDRGSLKPSSSVVGEDFAFAIEPVGTGMGRM